MEGTVKRYALAAALVVACLFGALASLLIALDVSTLRSALRDDDVTYRAAPEGDLWSPGELAPGGSARRLLGVRDDLLIRRAVRAVRLSHPEMPGFSDPSYVVHRNDATALLTDVLQSGDTAVRRSAAANLLGVLSFSDAIADYTNRTKLLESAAGRFRQAIALDQANDDAKYNLELTLARSRGLELTEAGGGNAPSPGGKGSKGAGAGDPGSGY
jgi:hypothetical protein